MLCKWFQVYISLLSKVFSCLRVNSKRRKAILARSINIQMLFSIYVFLDRAPLGQII